MCIRILVLVSVFMVSACSSMKSKDDLNQLPPTASGTEQNVTLSFWSSLSGKPVRNLVKNVRFPDQPSSVEDVTAIDYQDSKGDKYGQRIVGLLRVETSGDYRFRVSADHSAEVWLSADDNPLNKRLIAYTTRPTGYQVWDTFGSQTSGDISLQEGEAYFIEVLHKEQTDEDYLSVAWEGPGMALTMLTSDNISAYNEIGGGNEAELYKAAYHVGYASGMNLSSYDSSYPIPDKDLDGVPDFYELIAGTDPNDLSDALADGDGDELTNYEEYLLLSNPNSSDTDGDSLPDGFEVAYGLAVLDAADALGDLDGDGISNLVEYQSGTDPSNNSDFPSGPVERLVTLSWEVPTQRQDGSQLTVNDIRNYRIYSGPNSGSLNSIVDIGDPTQQSYSQTLLEGTYYYGISTVTKDGAEGPMSDVIMLNVN